MEIRKWYVNANKKNLPIEKIFVSFIVSMNKTDEMLLKIY